MRYTVILEQEPDGGYVATVPALLGCVSQGDTRDEVLKNIREAADLYVDDCIASGDPVPTGSASANEDEARSNIRAAIDLYLAERRGPLQTM